MHLKLGGQKMLKRKISAVVLSTIMILAVSKPVGAIDVSVANGNNDTNRIVVRATCSEMVQGDITPFWLGYGPITQYPAEGGTWEYGFWNAKVRSYYTVNRCHGSTVKLNDKVSRSIDTASGKTSIADIWTAQHNGDDRYYYRVCD